MASGNMPEGMTAHLKGNRYTNAIYLCVSGMRKISAASRIPRGRKVFRGMAGFRLPDVFVVAGEDGGRGGAEFAFMSCTTNKEVAVSYINAAKGLPILFEFEVGSIDRGAPLSFLSEFPGEDEVLIPPLSFLEVTGEPWTMDTDKGPVTVFPARINCNLKGQTMEEIEARRRTDLLAMEPYLKVGRGSACSEACTCSGVGERGVFDREAWILSAGRVCARCPARPRGAVEAQGDQGGSAFEAFRTPICRGQIGRGVGGARVTRCRLVQQ